MPNIYRMSYPAEIMVSIEAESETEAKLKMFNLMLLNESLEIELDYGNIEGIRDDDNDNKLYPFVTEGVEGSSWIRDRYRDG